MAGVSEKTAERALSGVTKDKRRDAKERADRVRQIARKYGYRPSAAALALRRGKSGIIGFVVDILTDQFLSAAVETAMMEAARADYKIALQIVHFDAEQTLAAFQSLLAAGAEGIITSCAPTQLPSELISTLSAADYPIFTLCGQSGFELSSAAADYSAALPEALKELQKLGHDRVTFCLFSGKELDNQFSEKIFTDSCRDLGIKADFRVHNDHRQAQILADEQLPAVILYGKYSMRVYLDRCQQLAWHPDVIGIYNEWTLAAAQDFALRGIILESAKEAVCRAIQQIILQLDGGMIVHHRIAARFIPENEFHALPVANLANQYLPELE